MYINDCAGLAEEDELSARFAGRDQPPLRAVSPKPLRKGPPMKTRSVLSLAGAALLASVAAANASLIIVPNGNAGGIQATTETALDGGPGFPTSLYGYVGSAYLQAADTGYYKFTFEGSGNSAATNTFTFGTTTFTSNPPGGTGTGSTPAGTSFTEFLTAGTTIAFNFTSSTGCNITAPNTSSACAYLVALAGSVTSPGATGPQSTAWIGLSDSAYPTADSDFQDMVVRVDQIPEPASSVLLGAGLIALGLIRRRKAG